MSDKTREDVREAIEKNWAIPIGITNPESYTVTLRLHFSASGIITQIDVVDDKDDPAFHALVESARRAVLITQDDIGRLPIPTNQLASTIDLVWDMKQICQQMGGC